jgi:hypothetical protein
LQNWVKNLLSFGRPLGYHCRQHTIRLQNNLDEAVLLLP